MSNARRGSWTVTAINGVVAVTVLVLVAVLALVVKPPAPPGIAAFAPQAAKPITKAPDAQSAEFGTGAGACGEGQECEGRPSASPSASTAAVAASLPPKPLRGALPAGLQCYEWPDGSVTQTFDPQSPPCVSVWDDAKGNGGATSPGVSGTEIRVALPVHPDSSTWPALQPLVDFFNTRFQFYGRKITIVPVPSQQAGGNVTGDWNVPQWQRADAAEIAKSNVFATLDFFDPIPTSWTLPVFLDVMAKHKIVSINGGEITPYGTATDLQKRAPYAWSYYPTLDQIMSSAATMTCRQLVGKNAAHAPDPALKTKPRKFAIVLPTDEDLGGPMPGLSSMLSILAGCGVKDPKVVRRNSDNQNTPANTAAFRELAAGGVTSVIFLPFGTNGTIRSPLIQAEQAGFRPEWVVVGWYNYLTAFMLNDPEEQTSGAFGVGVWNKQPQLALEPWHQAMVAAGGNAITSSARSFYQELMLLASGIQMAGPRLTPESFAEGLHTTTFPNPGAGTAPFYQATVGFADRDVIMTKDYTAFWLDTRTRGDETSNLGNNEEKALCMVGRGLRWLADAWPTTDRFYERGVCR